MRSGEVMDAMISEREELIRKLETEKKGLYDSNKENVDARDKLEKKSGGMGFLIGVAVVAILISVLFLGSPTKWIVIGVSACAFIGGIFGKSQFSAPIKEYNNKLSKYDERVSAISKEIAGYREEIAGYWVELKKLRFEEKHEQYLQNHICVYSGYSLARKRKLSECEKPEHISDNTTIYIDGLEIGDVKRPFTAYEVSPGTHIVKIVFVIGGIPYESKAEQIRVDGRSKFVLFHCILSQECYIRVDEFTDVHRFMEASNQKY